MNFILYASSRLEIIFNIVVYMSIVGSILGLFVSIINKLGKNKISPKYRMLFWIITVIMLIIPINFKSKVSIYKYLPYNPQVIINNNISRETWIISDYNDSIEKNNSGDLKKIEGDERIGINIIAVLPALWFIITFTLILIHTLLYVFYKFKLKKNSIVEDSIFNKCIIDMNINNTILIKQNDIQTAAVYGLYKRYVLVNEKILCMNDEYKKYIFLHELNHIKRRDNYINSLLILIQCIHFFNPVVYYLVKEIRNDIEETNDGQILRKFNDEERKEYSKLLVNLSSGDYKIRPIQFLGISETKKRIESRIKSIQRINFYEKNNIFICITSLIIIALILVILCGRNNNYMSVLDIKKLSQKANNIDNVLIEMHYKDDTFDDEKITYIYRKDSKELIESPDEIYWTDMHENKSYNVHKNDFKVQIVDYIFNVLTLNDEYFKSWLSNFNKGYIYEFGGIEKVNDCDSYKCIMHKIDDYETIWISVDTGFLTKIEEDFIVDNKNIHTETEFFYSFDVVKEDDIKDANMNLYSNYTIIEI